MKHGKMLAKGECGKFVKSRLQKLYQVSICTESVRVDNIAQIFLIMIIITWSQISEFPALLIPQ